jgi:transcriptional regulator with XRE-family HTH domain
MPVLQLQAALGIVIRTHRTNSGYSQESFAEKVGLHRTYIGAVERGERNVSLQNLVRIAEALRLPLSELIAEAEQMSKREGQRK